jgi:lysophospholipase L1-like esterase
LVARLDHHLRQTGQSWNLPIPVELLGMPGMRIRHIRSQLDAHIQGSGPAYLILHVGANDIGALQKKQWKKALEEAVLYVRARWPSVVIIWSDMLPREKWRYSKKAGAESSRKTNNYKARGIVQREGGRVIKHETIVATPALLASDGVHLTKGGQDELFKSLEKGLGVIVGNLAC